MRNKIGKIFVLLIMGGIILALCAFNALLLWVATGPRPLTMLTPTLERALDPADKSYRVHVGESWLIWDGWKHPLTVSLRQVELRNAEGQLFSTFSEIALDVDIPALFTGQVLPTALTVMHPSIKLFEREDHSISFGINQPLAVPTSAAPAPPLPSLLSSLWSQDKTNGLRKLDNITIRDATIALATAARGKAFEAQHADVSIKRGKQSRIELNAKADVQYSGVQSPFTANLVISQDQPDVEANIALRHVMLASLADLLPLDAKYAAQLSASHLPLDASAHILLSKDGALKRLHFAVTGGKGEINSPALDGSIPLNSLHAEGVLGNNMHDLQIDTLAAEVGGALLTAHASLSFNNGEIAAYGHASGKHMPVDSMHLFWPPGVSKNSRAWVIGNITGGTIASAEAKIDIHFGDLTHLPLPKEDIEGVIDLDGTTVRYLPDHPQLRNVSGRIHVDGASLVADLSSADFMEETTLSNGKVAIDNLNDSNPYIKVSLDAATTAKDAVRFLALPRLGHAKRLNLLPDAVSGTVNGSATLGFHFFSPRDAAGNKEGEDLSYDIKAKLAHVSQAQLLHKFDIVDGNGSVAVNNKQLSVDGSAEVNGAAVSAANVTYLFQPKNGVDTFIIADATAPVNVLPRFGYPAFSFITGILGVHINSEQGDSVEHSTATLDLTHATLNVPDIAWSKPAEVPATLELSAAKQDGALAISAFHVKSADTDTSGSALLSKDLSHFTHIALKPCHYGLTDVDSLIYESREDGFMVEAYGKALDLTRLLAHDPAQDSTFSFEHFPSIRFKGDIGRLILDKDREINGFKGMADCSSARCEHVDLAGATLGKDFTMRIARDSNEQRQLDLHSQDAGAFLKTLDVLQGVEGGELSITGHYDDGQEPILLAGTIAVGEHLVKHTPILARILSLASLTGFFDTLQGHGIRFTALHAPFTLQHDVITLTDATTSGPAIGLTAGGTITLPHVAFDLRGTVVPSYTLNSVLGKVPLIGKALTGGEGQGIFAARYHVTGTEKHPDVSVNPLSMLTPGFTRKIFDMFDRPGESKD